MSACIFLLGEPCLRERAIVVTDFDSNIQALGQTLVETMYAAKGIGLAAPQIGVLKRAIVVRIRDESRDTGLVMINPRLTNVSQDTAEGEEGCLSIPGVRLSVTRARAVTVHFQDVVGKEHEMAAEGMLAVCIQHEIDHLDGTLILDHVSRLRRDRAKTQFEKFKRLHR